MGVGFGVGFTTTAFGISRSLMTIELNRVIKAGLVEATLSSVDGRVKALLRIEAAGASASDRRHRQ